MNEAPLKGVSLNEDPLTETPLNETPLKTYPTEGTNLYRVIFDSPYRRAFHGQLKRYNTLVVWLYRTGLPSLFGVSRTVMLLTTRGKKSGKLRSTPIGYFRIGGALYLFSAWGKGTSWFKNMLANSDEVWIQVGLRKWHVQAQPLEDPAAIQSVLVQFIAESPAQAKYVLGWEPGIDRIENADFSAIVQRVLIIRFEPKR